MTRNNIRVKKTYKITLDGRSRNGFIAAVLEKMLMDLVLSWRSSFRNAQIELEVIDGIVRKPAEVNATADDPLYDHLKALRQEAKND